MWKARETALKFDGTRQRRLIRSNRHQIPSHDQNLPRRSVKILRRTLLFTSALIGSLALPAATHADQLVWVGGIPALPPSATSNDYNNAANWSPGRFPSVNDVAIFGPSNNTDLTLTFFANDVETWNFTSTTDYTFNIVGPPVALPPVIGLTPLVLGFNTGGITGNSSHVTFNNNTGVVAFDSASSAGQATFNNLATVWFRGNSTAANATFNNAGFLEFFDAGTAGNATIKNTALAGFIGSTTFRDQSSAGNATIINTSGGGGPIF
jgi:hypothetical protein